MPWDAFGCVFVVATDRKPDPLARLAAAACRAVGSPAAEIWLLAFWAAGLWFLVLIGRCGATLDLVPPLILEYIWNNSFDKTVIDQREQEITNPDSEIGIANKRNKSKLIFGGQMKRSSILLSVGSQRQLKLGIGFVIFFEIISLMV